ncbi:MULTISPECIES: haloacid dehalogenase type II [unclassified Mesorhizobium]|uniref:haloacid dehalogenase type II n=1 Tax=unclassified Mesorhizobium TaxID=325217 RepID=UPI000FD54470|nr:MULTISPECIES: haloacid dehalogenase type II [unclassified Mesorhizobium]RVB78813.1 haloacid dehalogenase type II [Mesorhizobium sp. M6A.T.Cr.TU.014.01.1.1]RWQ09285.1 MAG: haloacid dehalogenase type II [Mesorhizobium sp.]RWQ12100.1 MAG: haloacid dehalogenase type II [Mesorhizobium sp.]
MSDDLALKTADGWLLYNDQAFTHFDYFKRQQDRSLLPRLTDHQTDEHGELKVTKVEVLFFDVLGTVVDWRGSIAAEASSFLKRHDALHIDAGAFADAWVGRYDPSVEAVRCGQRPFVPLDLLNMENLEACLKGFGLTPSAFPSAELEDLNLAWHRLKPWPDSVEGLSRLKERFIVAPLSDGNTRLLVDMAKHAGLPWDTILGADVSETYKPMPQVYLRACELLGVEPNRAMLVAAHDYDLDAARRCGLKTAYVVRSNAHDPSKAAAIEPLGGWEYMANNLTELAAILK